jgi:hypothetical protein
MTFFRMDGKRHDFYQVRAVDDNWHTPREVSAELQKRLKAAGFKHKEYVFQYGNKSSQALAKANAERAAASWEKQLGIPFTVQECSAL